MLIYGGTHNDCGSGQSLRNTLARVINIDLNAVIAPRKQEKFVIPSNTLVHLQTHQQSLFMHENRQ